MQEGQKDLEVGLIGRTFKKYEFCFLFDFISMYGSETLQAMFIIFINPLIAKLMASLLLLVYMVIYIYFYNSKNISVRKLNL